jgi:hypothetical protein
MEAAGLSDAADRGVIHHALSLGPFYVLTSTTYKIVATGRAESRPYNDISRSVLAPGSTDA